MSPWGEWGFGAGFWSLGSAFPSPSCPRHDQGSTAPRRWQHSVEHGAVMPASHLQVCSWTGYRGRDMGSPGCAFRDTR